MTKFSHCYINPNNNNFACSRYDYLSPGYLSNTSNVGTRVKLVFVRRAVLLTLVIPNLQIQNLQLDMPLEQVLSNKYLYSTEHDSINCVVCVV